MKRWCICKVTFCIGGPEAGLRLVLLALGGGAGTQLQLLQHGGADLLQAAAVQTRLLTHAVHRQRVRRQTLRHTQADREATDSQRHRQADKDSKRNKERDGFQRCRIQLKDKQYLTDYRYAF